MPHGIKQSLVYYENVDVRVIGESAGEIVWAEAEPGLCATDDGNIVRGDRQPASQMVSEQLEIRGPLPKHVGFPGK